MSDWGKTTIIAEELENINSLLYRTEPFLENVKYSLKKNNSTTNFVAELTFKKNSIQKEGFFYIEFVYENLNKRRRIVRTVKVHNEKLTDTNTYIVNFGTIHFNGRILVVLSNENKYSAKEYEWQNIHISNKIFCYEWDDKKGIVSPSIGMVLDSDEPFDIDNAYVHFQYSDKQPKLYFSEYPYYKKMSEYDVVSQRNLKIWYKAGQKRSNDIFDMYQRRIINVNNPVLRPVIRPEKAYILHYNDRYYIAFDGNVSEKLKIQENVNNIKRDYVAEFKYKYFTTIYPSVRFIDKIINKRPCKYLRFVNQFFLIDTDDFETCDLYIPFNFSIYTSFAYQMENTKTSWVNENRVMLEVRPYDNPSEYRLRISTRDVNGDNPNNSTYNDTEWHPLQEPVTPISYSDAPELYNILDYTYLYGYLIIQQVMFSKNVIIKLPEEHTFPE